MFRKVARPMLASVYIADGVDMLANTDSHVAGTEAVLSRVEKVIPRPYSTFVPRDPELVARAVGGVKVVAGSTLALGKAQRLSAAALALASIPTLLGRYSFWSGDAAEKSAKRSGFFTQIGLLGGLLITVSDTQGKPGIVWRTRHATKVTKKEVQRALPGKSDTEKLVAQASDRVQDYAGSAKVLAATGAAKASERLGAAEEQAEKLWDERGRDLLDQATEKANEYYSAAQDFIDDNKDDWLAAFRDNAKALKHKAVTAAELAQQRADEAADVAADKSSQYRKQAAKTAKKNKKKAVHAKKKALKTLEKKFG